MPLVVEELNRMLDRLGEGQSFTVIFANEKGAFEAAPAGLKLAARRMRHRAKRWLDPDANHIHLSGRFDPAAGLETAMDYAPTVLWILTDWVTRRWVGPRNPHRLVALASNLNRGGETRINVAQFFTPDPRTHSGGSPNRPRAPTCSLMNPPLRRRPQAKRPIKMDLERR